MWNVPASRERDTASVSPMVFHASSYPENSRGCGGGLYVCETECPLGDCPLLRLLFLAWMVQAILCYSLLLADHIEPSTEHLLWNDSARPHWAAFCARRPKKRWGGTQPLSADLWDLMQGIPPSGLLSSGVLAFVALHSDSWYVWARLSSFFNEPPHIFPFLKDFLKGSQDSGNMCLCDARVSTITQLGVDFSLWEGTAQCNHLLTTWALCRKFQL